jgi:hypothetical protein
MRSKAGGQMTLENLLTVLTETIDKSHLGHLTAFFASNPAPNWVIASDYVIGDRGRHRDTFCYTIYPVDDEIVSTQAEIRRMIPADLKNTSAVTDAIVECLRSSRRFSFCFVVRQGERFFDSVADVRMSLDMTLAMVEGRQNWGEQIRALKRLRQAAAANGFNFKLFSDITLASLFAAVIAMYVAKLTVARSMFWFSDRDSIVTAYNRVAFDLLGMHFYQACYEYGGRYESIRLGVGGTEEQPWYDELVRVPDYLAGALSAFDRETRDVSTHKHLALLTRVISDAPNIAVVETKVQRNAFGCETLILSHAPITPPLDANPFG